MLLSYNMVRGEVIFRLLILLVNNIVTINARHTNNRDKFRDWNNLHIILSL
jgi:hypothetical protein